MGCSASSIGEARFLGCAASAAPTSGLLLTKGTLTAAPLTFLLELW